MDNHPIPQDVSHFQFKLIGEMTIKQFGFVGAGAVLAWIVFSLPIFFLLKFFLVICFGGGGAIFAFVPIEGRPADAMVSYFFKALFTPNQYVFQKTLTGNPRTYTFLSNMPLEHVDIPAPQIQPINRTPQKTTVVPTHIPVIPQITQKPNQSVTYTQPPIQQSVIQTKQETVPAVIQQPAQPVQPVRPLFITTPVDENGQPIPMPYVVPQNQVLTQQSPVQQPVAQPIPQPVFASTTIEKSASPVETGLPTMPDFPNLIMGVVKDSRGNVLPNILIEVKDKDGNPVRAFKTNQLGQFASATPLLNGTYSILFEDPTKKHAFQVVSVETTGEIMKPIAVISVDAREELRKELFGGK